MGATAPVSNTSLVRNAWYIAALSEELSSEALFSRTILNTPVVLFRRANGDVAALLDRCPHRFAPLSVGRKVLDGLQCGYHGMVFDADGICIANPVCPKAEISEFARVPSFPAIERHRLIWIWMGVSERANTQDIPDYFQYDHPDWTGALHHMTVNCNYLLLVDNLMDLSHVSFVHGDILGNDDLINQEDSCTRSGEGTVSELRVVPNGKPTPVWSKVLGESAKRVDLWMDIHWSKASNIVLDVGSTPTGAPRTAGAGIINLDCLTPETETTTHYFYGHARQYAPRDHGVTRFWSDAMAYAFRQDKAILEAVQTRMGTTWNLFAMRPPPLINLTDKAAVLVRRKVLKLLREEAIEAGAESPTEMDSVDG